jgi:hypothetical protein
LKSEQITLWHQDLRQLSHCEQDPVARTGESRSKQVIDGSRESAGSL